MNHYYFQIVNKMPRYTLKCICAITHNNNNSMWNANGILHIIDLVQMCSVEKLLFVRGIIFGTYNLNPHTFSFYGNVETKRIITKIISNA